MTSDRPETGTPFAILDRSELLTLFLASSSEQGHDTEATLETNHFLLRIGLLKKNVIQNVLHSRNSTPVSHYVSGYS